MTMTTTERSVSPAPHWTDEIKRLGACSDAVAWSSQQRSLRDAWRACERGDWMLWLLGRVAGPPESESRKWLVLAACDCAELALPRIRDEYTKTATLSCLQAARAWAHDEATIEELRKARSYADYASHAAARAADDDKADAFAADAAAYAYDDVAAAAARSRVLARCADIVRAHYPEPPQAQW